MRKILLILALFLPTIITNGCGGGGSSTTMQEKTSVTINLGQTRTSSNTSGKLSAESSTIPSSIASIRFTISATDMVAIERVISVEGRTSISESFEVSNGANRHFIVEAMNTAGNILYRGETYADMNGTPVFLTIVMISTDTTPPNFAGLSDIVSTTTSLTLSWSPATDSTTPQDKMQYLIYMSATPGGEDFTSPNFTTSQGATSFTITGLNPGTVHYFIVRAMDESGNIDSNTVEKSASTISSISVSDSSTASGGYSNIPQDKIIDATSLIPAGKTVKRISVSLSYNAYSIPDQFQIIYEGNIIYDSGMTSGSNTVNISQNGSTPMVTIRVIGNNLGTVWNWSATATFAVE